MRIGPGIEMFEHGMGHKAGARRRDMLTWHLALRQYPDPSLPKGPRQLAHQSARRRVAKAASDCSGLHSLILDDNQVGSLRIRSYIVLQMKFRTPLPYFG
jgi:hypothetical protein